MREAPAAAVAPPPPVAAAVPRFDLPFFNTCFSCSLNETMLRSFLPLSIAVLNIFKRNTK